MGPDLCDVHNVGDDKRVADTRCPCGCGLMVCAQCAYVASLAMGAKVGPDGMVIEEK